MVGGDTAKQASDFYASRLKISVCKAEVARPWRTAVRLLLCLKFEINNRKMSMQLSHSVIDTPPEAIIVADSKKNIISWNPTAEKVFGWSCMDAVGRNISELIVPVSHRNGNDSSRDDILAGHGKNGEAYKLKSIVQHRDGHKVPVEFTVSHLNTENGSMYLICARDIFQRWQVKSNINTSFRSRQIIYDILDISLKTISLDEQLELILDRILAIPTIKLLSNGAILLIDEGDPLSVKLKVHRGFTDQQQAICARVPIGKCHCGRAAQTGEIQFVSCIDHRHDFIFANMTPHGHYCVPIQSGDEPLGVIALYVEEGHQRSEIETDTLTAVANVLAGIVERARMQIQLEKLVGSLRQTINDLEDEKKFNESIISGLDSGLLILDNRDRIVKSNPAGRRLMAVLRDGDIEGLRLHDLIGIEAADQVLSQRDGKQDVDGRKEILIKSSRGGARIFEYGSDPREDISGRKLGTIVSFADITGVRKMQQEMEKMNRYSTVAAIASAVAHEIRNPLAGIKTITQAIEEELDETDEKKESIGRVIKQIDRLNVLLTDFFTYARPPKPRKAKVSIQMIIEEIRPLVHARLLKNNISFMEKYEENLPRLVVDPHQIQQVFLNLMLNSIEAVGANGFIELRAEFVDEDDTWFDNFMVPSLKNNMKYVVIHFRDNGCGVPDELANKVFEPFFTSKHEGSGLGLAIVYRILKENNANIFLENRMEKGTTFILFFGVE